jgi:hypothetical protein
MYEFIPLEKKESEADLRVPFFEDARSDYAPYYQSPTWSISKAKAAVQAEFSKLGAAILDYEEGDFMINGQRRRGYQLHFTWNGAKGRLMVAGLPISKGKTDNKYARVRIQALLNVRDWIKAAVTARIFSPGEHPLIPHLVLKSGKTLAERIVESAGLPELPAGDIVDGEVLAVHTEE